MMPVPSLIIEKGKDKGLSAEIKNGQIVTIGRDSASGLHLSDTLASRNHCRIEGRGGKFFVVDTDSRNGTYLNGRSVGQAEPSPGDQVLVGETLITFQAEPPAVDPIILKEIGGYRILQLLGKGGMGRVYKALQLSLDRIVAIKILSKRYASNSAFVERFRREATALAKLSHPNIVAVYDVGETEGLHYFSMEYMQGGSIAQRISRGRKMPPEEALRMIIDVARGLTYAEEKGLVHRDVKPENMMLDNAGTVKLCDLGIAQSIDETVQPTSAHGVFGSPHYIAPEQAMGGQPDHRADIYSLGASFYRIVTGRTMFKGTSARDVILKHIHEKAPSPKEVDPSLPIGLCRAIERMTSRDPGGRYQSAVEVVKALQEIQEKMREPRVAPRTSRRRSRFGRKRKWLTSLFVALAVIVALWVVSYLL